MKRSKIIGLVFMVVGIISISSGIFMFSTTKSSKDSGKDDKKENVLKELPKPEVTGGSRGELGIDKNINESTIDDYLNRPDSVYRDMRMLEDPANYEAIGGDRYLSGYIKGFEVVPLPYIIPVEGLPSEVGETYTGTTLFRNENGTYIANYEESMSIIEELFPKDKVIFLMCGGGGYGGMMRNFLISLGWDENKIYNIGGHWYYKGKNNVEVKKVINGEVTYDFDSVPYHKIDFDKLTKSENYMDPHVKVEDVKISNYSVELEIGNSYKLVAYVLPNEATNKEVTWESSDEKVATVDQSGLVKAVGEGKAAITVTSVEGIKSISSLVTVVKPPEKDIVELDDISEEINEFNLNSLDNIWEEFNNLINLPDGSLNPTYYDEVAPGEFKANDLWQEEYAKLNEKIESETKRKAGVFNSLVDNKKTFIILFESVSCYQEEYSTILSTKKILDDNNIQYLYVPSGDQTSFNESKLYFDKFITGTIIIVKDGEIYGYTDPEKHSFKSDEEVKNWFNNYLEVH